MTINSVENKLKEDQDALATVLLAGSFSGAKVTTQEEVDMLYERFLVMPDLVINSLLLLVSNSGRNDLADEIYAEGDAIITNIDFHVFSPSETEAEDNIDNMLSVFDTTITDLSDTVMEMVVWPLPEMRL